MKTFTLPNHRFSSSPINHLSNSHAPPSAPQRHPTPLPSNHILYSLSSISVFCSLVRFHFELCKMWMLPFVTSVPTLSLLCSFSPLSLARLCAENVLVPLFLVHFFHFPRFYDFLHSLRSIAHPPSFRSSSLLHPPPDSRLETEHVLVAVSI